MSQPEITQKEIEARIKLRDDFEFYAQNCLFIRPKEGNLRKFLLNPAQKYIHTMVENQLKTRGFVRVIILKGRQEGCSTYIEGRFYWRSTHKRGIKAFILTHSEQATDNLFEMAKRFHELCPKWIRPSTKASNSKELDFAGLDSGYQLGTANNKSAGRSATIQLLHASEAAFYANAHEHAKGIMQTVPLAPGTEIFIESTANGVGNWFHQQWLAAEAGVSDYLPLFIPWFWMPEYCREIPKDFLITKEEQELKDLYSLTDGQIYWRRMKIVELSSEGYDGEKNFKQEYPNNAVEAFQMSGDNTYFSPDLVMHARKGSAEKFGELLIGVDPARFGDDRTAIIRRQGRVAFNLQTYVKKDTMEVTGLVVTIIQEEKPAKVFVDVGGLGAGIVDRLRELGYGDIVVAVNSGNKALNDVKYKNKRAEMWALGRLWMEDGPVQIPDKNSLHSDLCGARFKWSSNQQLVIESKEDMKKRGIRSSDEADALLLTFAFPVAPTQQVDDDLARKARYITEPMRKAYGFR